MRMRGVRRGRGALPGAWSVVVSAAELIRIESRELAAGEQVQTVDARELHAYLEVETEFAKWIERRIAEYSFEKGKDFHSSILANGISERTARRDYRLTLSMAKELAMAERTARGREVRRYFIDAERRYRAMVENHAANSAQALFERMLRFEARKDSPKLWEDDIVASLCRTYGIQRLGAELPAPLLGVIGWLYRIVIGDELYAELKARNPGGDKRDLHYQLWKETLRKLVDDDVRVILALSNTASDRDDFKARMLAHYRKQPLQLLLGGRK